jgi:hypothetical protein
LYLQTHGLNVSVTRGRANGIEWIDALTSGGAKNSADAHEDVSPIGTDAAGDSQ